MIEVKSLKKHYPISGQGWLTKNPYVVHAVDDVSFSIDEGEALGMVGESGSGKSTIGQMLLMQTQPTDGEIYFDGDRISHLPKSETQVLLGNIQAVFQDPFDSLNPRMIVRNIIAEPLSNMKNWSSLQIDERVTKLIIQVGLGKEHLNKYPHQLSGGQRQRIGIARAISVNPRFIVLDEPVSALDVSVQAQVVNLLLDIQKKNNTTFLFISHNLAIVEHVCSRIIILYLGKIVEIIETEKLHQPQLHPYTQALIQSIPVPDPTRIKSGKALTGEIGNGMSIAQGCRFSPRCPQVQAKCLEQTPPLIEISPKHWMACHQYHDF